MAESSPRQNVEFLTSLAIIDPALKLAAFVDVETTGLHPDHDEILEFGAMLFAYDDKSGEIRGIVDEYCEFQEPKGAIHGDAAKVNHITRGMVEGHSIDTGRVWDLLNRSAFIIAHNAGFDQRFLVKFMDIPSKPWLCSMNGLPWRRRGFPSMALQSLLQAHGIANNKAHRAGSDCIGAVTLLSLKGPKGKTYLGEMIGGYLKAQRGEREAKEPIAAPLPSPLSGDEQTVLEAIRSLVGDTSSEPGYRKSSSYVSVGADGGGYWYVRFHWGPHAKYIVLNRTAANAAEERVNLTTLEDLATLKGKLQASYDKALEWCKIAQEYGGQRYESPVIGADIEDLMDKTFTDEGGESPKRTAPAATPTRNARWIIGAIILGFILLVKSCLG